MDYVALTAAPFATDDDARAVLSAFHAGQLPRTAWNHRAHLTVALSFARQHAPDVALVAMRAAILRYNNAVGIENAPQSGYHETLTVFFMQVVSLHTNRHPIAPPFVVDANALVDAWGRHDLPLQYYSKDRLFSDEARARWLPPDGQVLPLH